MVEHMLWQPSATVAFLVKRAKIIQCIKQFFYSRNILEVETPILSQAAVTDVHIESFHTQYYAPGDIAHQHGKKLSLITSPEYHMKRLLTAGSGPIFQITKCFRNEEAGRYHNPEFTMLEWYRPGFDMMDIISEVDELLKVVLNTKSTERISYQEAFKRYLNIDPLEADYQQLYLTAKRLNVAFNHNDVDTDTLLQFLFAFGIEPHIGQESPVAVYHFPASQAALAQICHHDPRVAKRFEFYYKGIELANGFNELVCAKEQQYRFEKDNLLRESKKRAKQCIDKLFLAALKVGMPAASGVALGLDRLIMLALEANQLSEVISFNIERA